MTTSPRTSAHAALALCGLSLLLLTRCAALPGRSPVCLPGQHLDGARCVASPGAAHRIPFRRGYTTRVMQGYHGYTSHKEDLAYSVDLLCEEGDPITASRDGVVVDARGDSRKGCGDTSCVDMANYVVLDHGDGTYSEYYHLAYQGALVRLGQQVCAGQVIGMCGNTGFSTGPHLHFALTDITRQTLPVRFVEAERTHSLGFPIPDTVYRSENALGTRCAETTPSPLHPQAFAHQGILLDAPVPLTVRRGATVFRGRYLGDHPKVTLHYKPVEGGVWRERCVAVDRPSGRFEVGVKWDDPAIPEGYVWVMLTGADAKCSSPGWAWSYKIRVLGPPPPGRGGLRGVGP